MTGSVLYWNQEARLAADAAYVCDDALVAVG
jgi:hypothetical protein